MFTFRNKEIKRQVQDILACGIICPSSSTFSSSDILVRKEDAEDLWRFCVDYQKLNELLDKLHGALIFSKLDLRSGYHQIRMFEGDNPKTAFRTHKVITSFSSCPFGLSNAPAMFQALLNTIFKHFLRKFVLVFFNDILVYSHNLSEHVIHLTKIFHILREHQLKVKQKNALGYVS